VLFCAHINFIVDFFDGFLSFLEGTITSDVEPKMALEESRVPILKPVGLLIFYLID
jgi:hypothetical protein